MLCLCTSYLWFNFVYFITLNHSWSLSSHKILMNNLYLDAHCAIQCSSSLSQHSSKLWHGASSSAQHVLCYPPFLSLHAFLPEPSSSIATCSPCSSSANAAILRSASEACSSRSSETASASAEESAALERHPPRQSGHEALSQSHHGRFLQEAKCSSNLHTGIQTSC